MLHAYKHGIFLQIDIIIFDVMVKHFQSSQNSKFAMSLQNLKKEVRDEAEFLHADKHQNLAQVDFNTLSIKLFYKVILSLLMGIIKHSQRAQSNKLSIALQCLEKEVKVIKLFNKNLIKNVLHV